MRCVRGAYGRDGRRGRTAVASDDSADRNDIEFRATGADILAAIRTDKQITSATEEKLKAFLDGFAKVFA